MAKYPARLSTIHSCNFTFSEYDVRLSFQRNFSNQPPHPVGPQYLSSQTFPFPKSTPSNLTLHHPNPSKWLRRIAQTGPVVEATIFIPTPWRSRPPTLNHHHPLCIFRVDSGTPSSFLTSRLFLRRLTTSEMQTPTSSLTPFYRLWPISKLSCYAHN